MITCHQTKPDDLHRLQVCFIITQIRGLYQTVPERMSLLSKLAAGSVRNGFSLQALYAAQARADQPLDPVDDGGQQICHHQAHQHRRQNGCQLRHHPLQRAVHIKRVIEHQNGADGEKNRQAPFQIAALPFIFNAFNSSMARL